MRARHTPSERHPKRSLQRSSDLFAALGDPVRLGVVMRLADEGSLSIRRLTDGTQISRQAMTKHLVVLADAGVVSDRREGRERTFRLEPAGLQDAQLALQAISRRWDDAIERLRELVE